MKIGIEAERANNRQKTGVEHYAKELILQFAKLDTENEYVLYLRTQPEEWIKQLPKNFSYKVLPFPVFWTQLRLSWELFFHPVDSLFVPASAIPLYSPKHSVCTIHDAAFLFYPETFTWFMRNYLHWSYKYIGWKAKRIIVPSVATKNDLVKYYKIDEKKIVVIPHGYTPMGATGDSPPLEEGLGEVIENDDNSKDQNQSKSTTTPSSDASGTESRPERRDNSPSRGGERMRLPEKYVLFLSTLQPRKNLEGLIAAFRLFKEKHRDDPHKLVVAGRVGWKADKILEVIEKNRDIVVYLNHVSDSDRAVLYKNASAFCVPSFYEGFGMWILEAFDAGIPAVVSNTSSMPEVGGDAVEYCDPKSPESIALALEKVLLDKERAARLVELGHKRLSEYGWQQCAQNTLRVIESDVSD